MSDSRPLPFASSLANSAWVEISDESQVGEARRIAANLSSDLGFPETRAGELAIVVSEAAVNIIRYAEHGWIHLQPVTDGEEAAIDVIAADHGPGITDVSASMRDGVSTASSSSGTGLGAMRRLSSEFDIHSQPGNGTVVFGRIWGSGRGREPFPFAAVSVAKSGELSSGDGWAISRVPGGFAVFCCDGLGHGPEAAKATTFGIEAFRKNASRPVLELANAVHGAMRSTRGGAVAVARIEPAESRLSFVGVGNLSASVVSRSDVRGLVSQGGIMGHEISRIREFTTGWDDESLLVVHSDGLQTHSPNEWAPGLRTRHPAVIVGTMLRDYNRGRDDATALVAGEVFS